LRASDLKYKIKLKNNKYYAEFDLKMTTFIFLIKKYSERKHLVHEQEHIVAFKLLFLETLYMLRKFEDIGYDSKSECVSKAKSTTNFLHPLRITRRKKSSWWPSQNNLLAIPYDLISWVTGGESLHFKVLKKFVNKIYKNKINEAIDDFESDYLKNSEFDVKNYMK
jgi:hypothetical protein